MRFVLALLLVAALLLRAGAAAGGGPLRMRGAEDWDDRTGVTWEAGGGPRFGATSGGRGRGAETHLGAVAVLGVHRMLRYERERHEKWDWPEVEATRWCVVVACGGLGLIVAPPALFLGNEIGLDLRVTGGPDLMSVGVRPVLWYARGAFRTPSFAALFVPEVGATRTSGESTRTDLVLTWSLFPVDVRVTDTLSIGADPLRVGWMINPGGAPARADVAGELTVRFAP